ncbi:MAG TPA: O-antigen ligase family protein [Flavobacterium sp.]|nr:O-antigen ligase family protein [Flavobacterium sp.]
MKDRDYILLIIMHALLGILIYLFPFLSKIYAVAIIVFGFLYVLKTQNKSNNVLLVAGYVVGSEVFLRMTQGSFFYEFSKYGVMFFLLLGMYYRGFSKNALPMWIYLLLLVPGVIIATETLNLTTDIRKAILFNISGPLCLGVAGIYCYNRKILFTDINKILLFIGLPIISNTVYLILVTPDLKEVLVGTGSNPLTSGGFGPNQVATVFGLGMFVFFSRLLFESKSKLIMIVNMIIVFNISYRGLLTFSRGGMITGFFMIIILLLIIYIKTNSAVKSKLNLMFIFLSIIMLVTWLYASNETEGLIEKRYANQDASGRTKESQLSGREDIYKSEVNAFLASPVFGVGVAKGVEIREAETGGLIIASHNEITRMLAEHGILGIFALMILFITPMFLYISNREHLFLFCFILFWILTINHAAMRIAAPAFIYSLSLLKVKMYEDDTIHREQTV